VTAPVRAGAAVAGESYRRRVFKSLENRNYRFLWAGMLCTMAGMNMQMVARAQLAWDLTHSEFLTAFAGVGFAVPVLFLSLYGGAIADRVERKRLVQIGQVASSLNALWIAVAIVTHNVTVWHLFAASVVQGFFWAFMMPARQALIPQLVGKDLLGNAVAINASGMSLMTLLAPAVSGVLYARLGAGGAYFAITGVTFAAVFFTTMLPKLPAGNAGRKAKNVIQDMREGLRFILRNRTVLWLLAFTLGTTVLSMPFRQLMPVYADRVFGHGAESVGFMLTVFGAGALAGTLAIAGLTKTQKRGPILIATSFISGAGMLALAFITSYPLAVMTMVLPGLGESGRRSLNAALIMEETDEHYQGRVMGVYMMNFGLIPLGALPMGAVAQAFGIQAAIAGAGVLLLAVAVVSAFATPRIRQL
jgi:MFS family permease